MFSASSQLCGFSESRVGPVSQGIKRIVDGNRTENRKMSRRARCMLGFAILLALPGGAQYPTQRTSPPQMPTLTNPMAGPYSNIGDPDPVQTEKRLQALNALRQVSMVSDTNKLLKLARELDDEIRQSDSGSLDLAELAKVAEIEKLARKVREKMGQSMRDTTSPQPFVLRPQE